MNCFLITLLAALVICVYSTVIKPSKSDDAIANLNTNNQIIKAGEDIQTKYFSSSNPFYAVEVPFTKSEQIGAILTFFPPLGNNKTNGELQLYESSTEKHPSKDSFEQKAVGESVSVLIRPSKSSVVYLNLSPSYQSTIRASFVLRYLLNQPFDLTNDNTTIKLVSKQEDEYDYSSQVLFSVVASSRQSITVSATSRGTNSLFSQGMFYSGKVLPNFFDFTLRDVQEAPDREGKTYMTIENEKSVDQVMYFTVLPVCVQSSTQPTLTIEVKRSKILS
ncbi:DNA polymerase alpha subunit B [Acrasis kona]|uniref:DNA polymerase alpha subunit B n=1 Tax=Acrasis kona TaxID=1008807 RepID=A0AAW2YXC8_9EUKA